MATFSTVSKCAAVGHQAEADRCRFIDSRRCRCREYSRSRPHVSAVSADVVSLQLLRADGELVTCSRGRNPELFRMVVGGYGLFGVVVSVTLQLVRRQKIERVVRLLILTHLMQAFEARIRDGYTTVTSSSRLTLTRRDFSLTAFSRATARWTTTPHPIESTAPARRLTGGVSCTWRTSTSARPSWSSQTSTSARQASSTGTTPTRSTSISMTITAGSTRIWARTCPATEMITELYVPRAQLAAFMAAVREDFLRHAVDFIYGTIRLIAKDEDAFLAWAKRGLRLLSAADAFCHCGFRAPPGNTAAIARPSGAAVMVSPCRFRRFETSFSRTGRDC